ncbi:MAG: hypothetical protein QOJ59_3370 [Thermomicrobiales bacterium]|jgi:hypothetical protein|nr:hypothetical protein [Thermomicrobiales bacterium]
MTHYENLIVEPRVQAAIDDVQELIRRQYPAALFTLGRSEAPEGIYVRAIVDTDDMDAVEQTFLDRLVDLLVEEALPIYVVPVRSPHRIAEMIRAIREGELAVAIAGD